MMIKLIENVENIYKEQGVEDGKLNPVEGVFLLKRFEPTHLTADFYEPAVCLILQGAKETTMGSRTVRFGSGESLIVSHHLPVVSKITKASEGEPYLAVVIKINMSIIRGLYKDIGPENLDNTGAKSLDVNKAGRGLLDTINRYLATAYDPLEAQVIGAALVKELHFRLLRAPHGKMLREMLPHDSHASNVAEAITYIREHYKESLSVPGLAKLAGMSTSSFHQHFKEITETTPLQYQKDMRLLEAQRLITSEGYSVTTAAFEVGYESPTQFSREYSRKFGTSPRGSKPRTWPAPFERIQLRGS